MSLVSQIDALAVAVRNKFNAITTALDGKADADHTHAPRYAAYSGTNFTVDLNNLDRAQLTLTGNASLTLTGGTHLQTISIAVRQDATGGRTLTLPASVRFNGTVTEYTARTDANAVDYVVLVYNATDGKYDFLTASGGVA